MSFFYAFVVFSFSFFCTGQQQNAITKIDIEVMKSEVVGKDVQLIDVRFPNEFNNGHIEGAININSFDFLYFEENVLKLDKEKPIYVYCYSGVRSRRACKKLANMGFKNIYDFKAGYKAWSKQ